MPKPQSRERPANSAKRNGQMVKKAQPAANRRRGTQGLAQPRGGSQPAVAGGQAGATGRRHSRNPLGRQRWSGSDLDRQDACPSSRRRGLQRHVYPQLRAEVRGGTAHCHVKMGHRPIGSPIVEDAAMVVAMNEPSYLRLIFARCCELGSTLVVNSSLVPTVGKHPGVKIVSLELDEDRPPLHGQPPVGEYARPWSLCRTIGLMMPSV